MTRKSNVTDSSFVNLTTKFWMSINNLDIIDKCVLAEYYNEHPKSIRQIAQRYSINDREVASIINKYRGLL